jgi:hypothetical protein
MAYEYLLALPAEYLAPDFTTIRRCVEQRVGLHLCVVECGALECRYAFESTLRRKWPEDFAVAAAPGEWYVAFYCATGDQQARVLTCANRVLARSGGQRLF